MMRQLVAAAAMGLGLLATSANAATPNISGDWQIQGEIQSGGAIVSATPTCTFVQTAAGNLSGSCVGPNASGPLTGHISGTRVAWTWRNVPTTSIGINGETGFNGTYVDAHLIRGTMTSTAVRGSGTFTQTR
jgi:hypothetical protein